jgi:hypothetical protein
VTAKTRRRVFASLLVLALTLPAETILLKALQASNDTTAIQQWASGLSATSLSAAAANIQAYPFLYRKGILGALTPDQRASVWRRHLESYIGQHPELSGAAISAIKSAESALTSTVLSEKASSTERASLKMAAGQVQTLLGTDTAKYLMFYLGPQDGTFASAEPLTMKIASMVRHQFELLADYPQCDCSLWFGCSSGDQRCVSDIYCDADVTWPMCGWFLNDPCDGLCDNGY